MFDLSTFSATILAVFFFTGLCVLVVGAHLFVRGAASVSEKLKVSKFLIGSIVMSFATTSPELMVSLNAASHGKEWMAIGNVFGSYIANIGLVLGVSGLVRPIKVSYIVLHRQLPFSVAALICLVLLSIKPYFGLYDGVGLLLLLLPWLGWLISCSSLNQDSFTIPLLSNTWLTILGFVFGVILLQVGAMIMVRSAEQLAIAWGVSSYAIGLSLVAIGTSLPELMTGIVSAYHEEYELLLGNVLGANILLILLVLPLSMLMSAVPISLSGVWGDYFFMGLLSSCLWIFSTCFDEGWSISRIEAGLLFLLFCFYQFFVLQQ